MHVCVRMRVCVCVEGEILSLTSVSVMRCPRLSPPCLYTQILWEGWLCCHSIPKKAHFVGLSFHWFEFILMSPVTMVTQGRRKDFWSSLIVIGTHAIS